MAESLGAPVTVAVGGAACLVAALLFGLSVPGLRHEARELLIAAKLRS